MGEVDGCSLSLSLTHGRFPSSGSTFHTFFTLTFRPRVEQKGRLEKEGEGMERQGGEEVWSGVAGGS